MNSNMNKENNIEDIDTWNLFTTQRNNKAFSDIYHKYFKTLYYFGLKYTADIPVIEDSIQNLFIYILKNHKKLKLVKNVRFYLIKSFRNQLFREMGKQKRLFHSDQFLDIQFEYFNNIESNIIEKEENDLLKQTLKQSLKKLSTRQQEIIYLRFDNGLSYEEISEILEISVDSCYKLIYRSIKSLKADIESMHLERKSILLWFINRIRPNLFEFLNF